MKSVFRQEQNEIPVCTDGTDTQHARGRSDHKPNTETLSKDDLKIWWQLVEKSLHNALSGLSMLLGHELKLDSLNIVQMPVGQLKNNLNNSDSQGIGTYLSVDGDICGQVMLVHTPSIAYQLIDLLLDLPQGTTCSIGSIERYALEDIGNITGSYFFNTMADNAGLLLMPSPPEVIVDSMSTIMNIPVQYIEQKQKQAVLVEATFSADDQKMDGVFMALPTIDFIKAVTKILVTV